MSKPDLEAVHAQTAANRRLIADVLDTLTPEQWDVPSLCAGWRVREVAGHLVAAVTVSLPGMLGATVQHGFSPHRANTALARRFGAESAGELAALLRRHADTRSSPPVVGPFGQLTDTAIHLRDIARPLGLDADVPLSCWATVLDFLTGRAVGFVRKGAVDGLTLRATDQSWQHGTGPEVAGTSETLALALTGRAVALDELAGDGAPTLRARVLR